MTVLIILGVLFLALIIVVPLLERSKFRMSEQQQSKLGRWILPLLVLIAVINLVMFYVRN